MTKDKRTPIPADATLNLSTMTSTVEDTVWVQAVVVGYPDLTAESDRVPRRDATNGLAVQAQARLLTKVRPVTREQP